MKFRIIKEVDHLGEEIFKVEWFYKPWFWAGKWINAGSYECYYHKYFRIKYLELEKAENDFKAFLKAIEASKEPNKISVIKEFEI